MSAALKKAVDQALAAVAASAEAYTFQNNGLDASGNLVTELVRIIRRTKNKRAIEEMLVAVVAAAPIIDQNRSDAVAKMGDARDALLEAAPQ